MGTNHKKWTVFFLIRAVSGNFSEAEKVIAELLSTDLSMEVNIVICFNVKAEFLLNSTIIFPRGNTSKVGNQTTLFYELISRDGTTSLSLIEEIPLFDIRTEHDVSGFFKTAILHHNLADNYMIFTWDHGWPFAIFTDNDIPGARPSDSISIEENVSSKLKNSNPLITHFRQRDFLQQEINSNLLLEGKQEISSSTSDQDWDLLTITELKNAIKWAFGKIKIDVLVMVNCNLQYFDTGYELSGCVNYLVAFESYMYFENDLDYKAILNTLAGIPALTPKNVAQLIVSSFKIKVSYDNRNDDVNKKDKIALFANDLSWYPTMAKLFNELAINMTEQLPIYYDKIEAARNKCDYLEKITEFYCLVDFKNFITSLYNELPGVFAGKYELLIYVLDQIVLESYVGSTFKKQNPKLKCPTCFSIYFPEDIYMYNNIYKTLFINERGKFSSQFVKKFYWDNFVKAFVEFKYHAT